MKRFYKYTINTGSDTYGAAMPVCALETRDESTNFMTDVIRDRYGRKARIVSFDGIVTTLPSIKWMDANTVVYYWNPKLSNL